MAIGTTTAILMSLMAATSIVGASGALKQGKDQQDQADFNAQIQNYNAQVAEQSAQSAIDKAQFDEEAQRRETKKKLSTQLALYGASGISPDTGSPLLVMEETASLGELDALAIRYAGDVEASRLRSVASGYRMQGEAETMKGESVRSASKWSAATSILGGATKMVGAYNTRGTTKAAGTPYL